MFGMWKQKLLFFVLKQVNRIIKLSFVKTAYGVRLKANFHDATFKYAFCGSYGTYFSDYIKNYNGKFLFLDIGANQGLYSLIAAQNKSCDKIIALEPVSPTADLLVANVDHVNTKATFNLLKYALSNETTQLDLRFSETHSGRFSITADTQLRTNKTPNYRYETIRTKTADELSAMLAFDDLEIVCKIDVEGHEKVVLEELERVNVIQKCSSVMIEVNEDRVSVDELDKYFSSKGFKKVKIGSGIHYDCHYIMRT